MGRYYLEGGESLNRTGFKKFADILDSYQDKILVAIEKKEDALVNATDAEYPNEDRIERLEEEVDDLNNIKDLLDQLLEAVNNYVGE